MDQSTEELKYGIERTRRDMGVTIDAIEDRVRPGRMVQRQRNRFSNGMHSMRDRVMGVAHSAEESMTSAADTVRETPQTMTHATQGSPLMAGAIAFGLGFVAAAMFPPTDPERRLASKAMNEMEPAKQQLMGAARESAEHLKESAVEAGQQVKDQATSAAGEVRDTAREAVGEASDTVREEVRNRS